MKKLSIIAVVIVLLISGYFVIFGNSKTEIFKGSFQRGAFKGQERKIIPNQIDEASAARAAEKARREREGEERRAEQQRRVEEAAQRQAAAEERQRRWEACDTPGIARTQDGGCVWSCGVGTEPNEATVECVCRPGLQEAGIDQFGRRVCQINPVTCSEGQYRCFPLDRDATDGRCEPQGTACVASEVSGYHNDDNDGEEEEEQEE